MLHSIDVDGGPAPATYLYSYDTLGRLISSEMRDGSGNMILRTHQSYNEKNQLCGQSWQLGNTGYGETYEYNETDGSLKTMHSATGQTLQMGYDSLRRLTSVNAGIYTRTYAYQDLTTTQTTTQIASVTYSGLANNPTYQYTYDTVGNIATYTAPNGIVTTYTYDDQGQLLSAVGNRFYIYTYDNVGNILTANGHTYTYGSTIWRDLLTKFDGQTISYDNIGNPTSYYNGTRWAFTWNNGRQLVNASSGNDLEDVNISYVYDADGLRTSKTVTTNVYHVHEYTSEVCAPTCVTKGYTTYTCSCGDSYQGTYVAALGHLYDSVSDKICNRCGYDRSGSVDVPVDPVRPNPPVESASITAAETGDGAIVSSTTESHSYIYASGKLLREVITTTVDSGTPTEKVLDFFYDESGRPFAVKIDDVLYYYITNLQGDVMQIVNSNGTAVATYDYDPYGNIISATGALAEINPLRYRGYVYDEETGLYYVSSRYYDPEIGRWINADNRISGVGGNILGYNMFAYCMNNPVNMSDPSGNWPKWIETAANWVNNNIIQPVKNFFSSPKQSNVVNASSHDANRRPYNGEPGSTYTAPNGDSRTYGPDGTPEHDYDHDDHGRPDKHPHDPNGGHNHDWENGVRGPAYSVGWEPLAGAALVTVCVIGIVVVAADDATGIGVADDFLFGPLGAGVGEGLILIFG